MDWGLFTITRNGSVNWRQVRMLSLITLEMKYYIYHDCIIIVIFLIYFYYYHRFHLFLILTHLYLFYLSGNNLIIAHEFDRKLINFNLSYFLLSHISSHLILSYLTTIIS